MRLLPLLLLLPLGACGQLYTQQQVDGMRSSFDESLSGLKEYQAQLEAKLLSLKEQNRDLQVALEKQKAEDARAASANLDQAFSALQSDIQKLAGSSHGAVEYVMGPDGPVVRIHDRVLFPSGSAKLTEAGKTLLNELVPSLLEAGRAFRVEGHTDDQPLKVHAKDFPGGNLQLSAARALGVARLLIEKGLPAEQVSIAGYGPWRPVADNGTQDGRAQNRRVEIVVIGKDSTEAH